MEPIGNKELLEFVEPSTRSLFELVESFLQLANVRGEGVIDEAARLFHIDILMKITIEEGVVDVKLVEGPVSR